MSEWRNWSGSVRAQPAAIVRPRTEAELARSVAQATAVRVAGAGHSFMPLCETDGLLVSLADLEGEIEIDAAAGEAWAPAGMSLAALTAALWERGWSLHNQGDVNPQSLAGALATGTHGTGMELGSLSTAARAFRLVLADGSIVTCSPSDHPDLFQAQRLSLGLLGVATRVKIAIEPRYWLEERVYAAPFDEVLHYWDEVAPKHRHAEFFLFPYGELALVKTLDPAPEDGPLKPATDENAAFQMACDLCAFAPAITPWLQRRLITPTMRGRRTGPAYQVFPAERTVRFEEMEYEIPRDAGLAALRAAIDLIRAKRWPIAFPFEFRTVAADDIWLSPCNAGPVASVSMHQYAKMPWREPFAAVERLFRDHGGRPHWAKRHTLTAREIEALYPKSDAFRRVRDQVDPTGKFANAHLRALFSIPVEASAHA